MPFIGNRLTSEIAAATSTFPDVASIIDELSDNELSKTARRFGRSTAIPFRGTSRSEKYRKEVVIGDCPKGQNYYACQSTGFKGCCSKNVCDPNVVCPENNGSKSTASKETSSEATSKSVADTSTHASTHAASTKDSNTGAAASHSETREIKSSVTSASGKPAEPSKNATSIKATADVSLAPSCPSGNGTTYTDDTNIAYVVRCNSDNTAASFNSVQVKIGGYAQCFSSCSSSADCAGFTYVGLDDGTCYLKSTLPKDSFVAKSASNYISCGKIDPRATASTPTPSATPTPTSDASARQQPNKGAIAGGVVGGIAIIALVLFLIAFLARRRRKNLESRRTTITHVHGGAVEPGRHGDDNGQSLPLHNRNGSTSHDVFAPYGGYQRAPNGSITRDYASQSQTTSPASYKGQPRTPYPDTLPSSRTEEGKASSPGPFILPATTYQPPTRSTPESIPMLDSTPVPRSADRSPRFHEYISELADTSSPPPVLTPGPHNRRWGSVLYANNESPNLGLPNEDGIASSSRDGRLEEARRRQQQLHLMSWNNYDQGQAAELEGGGSGVGATIGSVKTRPGDRNGNAEESEGEVSPDHTDSPLDRKFIVSPLGSLGKPSK